MSVFKTFPFAPGPWYPIRDAELLEKAALANIKEYQGRQFEHPDFDFQVVFDVHNYFSIDLYNRIRRSDEEDTKLVLLLPSPENSVYISTAEALNRYNISCRNVHVFFTEEYANEKGDVAPYESPVSRSGQFVKHFYNRLKPALRMPMEQIHFWTKENTATYSDLIAAEGGADVVYTFLTLGGGVGAIDYETFPAETMDEFMAMGCRYVTPMPETIAMDSLRGMFGASGDIAAVPPCAVTVGPRDIALAKERMHMQFLCGCGGKPTHQAFALRLALLGPVSPKNPGSMMRIMSGTCYAAETVTVISYPAEKTDLVDTIEAIRAKEAK